MTSGVTAEHLDAADAALAAGDPGHALKLLSPFFNGGLNARGLWLVARAMTRGDTPAQALDLYRHAFRQDPTLPFIEVRPDETVLKLADTPGSLSLLTFAEEAYRDSYGLGSLGLKPGDVFVDVGANVGFVSVRVARRYPGARVLALEPAPETFGMLQTNVATNGAEGVTAINRAVNGDGRDLDLLFTPGDSGAANAFCGPAVIERFRREMASSLVTVPGMTLDALFDDHGIDRCAVLKLDCEGAEREILRTTGVLERVDRVVMELHIGGDELRERDPAAIRDDFIGEVLGRVATPPRIDVVSMVSVLTE